MVSTRLKFYSTLKSWNYSFLSLFKDCSNGDVKFNSDSSPMIFWNDTWSPICGHHFWNDHNGATKFCEQLGCFFGGTVAPLFGYENYNGNVSYIVSAIQVGRCLKDDVWGECSGGCNGGKLGGNSCYKLICEMKDWNAA